MRFQFSKSNIYRTIYPIFFLILFMKFTINENKKEILIFLNVLFVFIGVLITYNFFNRNYSSYFVNKFIGFLAVCSFINFIFSANCRVQDLFLSLTYMGLGLIPLYIRLNYEFYKWVLIVVVVYFCGLIYLDIDPNLVFNVSRNFVSIVLLVIYGLHLISSVQNEKQPSLLLLFACFFISIWAIGRGGILTFGYLVIFYPLVVKLKLKFKLIFLTLYLVGLFYVINSYSDYLLKIGFERFQSMGVEDSRTDINNDYVNESTKSFSNIFIGSPLNYIPSIVEVEGNPHNSFIRLHIYYGLFGFIFIVINLIVSSFKLLINKHYFLLYFLFALLLRSSTDSAAFHGSLDPLIFFIIFFTFKDRIIINKFI